jgi:hypothetical protein
VVKRKGGVAATLKKVSAANTANKARNKQTTAALARAKRVQGEVARGDEKLVGKPKMPKMPKMPKTPKTPKKRRR